ncbi:hypothetical protein OIU76_009950 [Salix suchowensis]|nr:hypothetical protein OIU76_009950 [Salix suchowensis]
MTSTKNVVTGTEVVIVVEAEALMAVGVEVATVAVVEMEVVIGTAELDARPKEQHSCCMEWAHCFVYWRKHVFESLMAVGVEVAAVAVVEMEVVTGADELDAVTEVEMEVVIGAAELDARPKERHSCCMEWAHYFVYWRKHVFEVLLAVGVEVATVAVVEMEVVTGAAELDAVAEVEMEVVIGAAELDARPKERHSCCMEWAHYFVHWRKHVFEVLLAVGVEVATVAVVEMEVVTGAAELDAVAEVEMEVVIGAAELDAQPKERHSCCMEWAHCLQDRFEKHMDNLVYWTKHVFEAWFWRLVGCGSGRARALHGEEVDAMSTPVSNGTRAPFVPHEL